MRIIFTNELVRNSFFCITKKRINLSNQAIIKNFDISKATFERYISGEYSVPENIFLYLLKYLNHKEKTELLKYIIKKPDNWGSILGGKIAYKKNKDFFVLGRLKGINVIKNKRKLNRPINIRLDFPLTERLCEFIGAFIGDGFMNFYRNNLYHIEFTGDSEKDYEYYIKKIIPIIKELIPNLNPHIRKVNNHNAIRLIFYSRALFDLLHKRFKLPKGKKVYIVNIPIELMNSEDKFINSTIRGIFDTDGCVFLDKRKIYRTPYPRITLQTASEPLYLQLKEYLSKHFKLYSGHIKKRNIYYLEVYGKQQLYKWMSMIGFSNPRHLNKVARVAQQVEHKTMFA